MRSRHGCGKNCGGWASHADSVLEVAADAGGIVDGLHPEFAPKLLGLYVKR